MHKRNQRIIYQKVYENNNNLTNNTNNKLYKFTTFKNRK